MHAKVSIDGVELDKIDSFSLDLQTLGDEHGQTHEGMRLMLERASGVHEPDADTVGYKHVAGKQQARNIRVEIFDTDEQRGSDPEVVGTWEFETGLVSSYGIRDSGDEIIQSLAIVCDKGTYTVADGGDKTEALEVRVGGRSN